MSDASILRNVLRPDERFYWTVRGSIADLKYHPLVWLGFFGLVLSFVPAHQHGWLDVWFWVMIALTLGVVPTIYCKRIYTSYTLTNKRLILISGIFTKDIDEIELFRVADSTCKQSLVDLWVNLGTITVTSTDRTGTIIMKKIPYPNQVRDSLREAYMKARSDKGTVILESLG